MFHFADEKVRIKSVAVQGKPSSDDCVTEYFVQYSDDGESWANYVDSTGEFEVKPRGERRVCHFVAFCSFDLSRR